MSKTTIQIPIDTSLRNKAEVAATAAGFSSLQEVVRVFLSKFSNQAVHIGFYESDIQLSKKAEKRYSTMINDARNGKNTIKSESFEELISILK